MITERLEVYSDGTVSERVPVDFEARFAEMGAITPEEQESFEKFTREEAGILAARLTLSLQHGQIEFTPTRPGSENWIG